MERLLFPTRATPTPPKAPIFESNFITWTPKGGGGVRTIMAYAGRLRPERDIFYEFRLQAAGIVRGLKSVIAVCDRT